MYLIDNIYFVLPYLWWDPDLGSEFPDIVYRVVGRGIQFKNVECKILVIGCSRTLVDLFCQDTGTSSFAYPSRTREQQGLRQMIIFNGVGQCIGNSLLPNDILECLGPIFSSRYYKGFQDLKLMVGT